MVYITPLSGAFKLISSPKSKYTYDDIFNFVIYALTSGKSIYLDFYKYPGPYGYKIPCSIVMRLDKNGSNINHETIFSGYPIIYCEFEKEELQNILYNYLRYEYFERISYEDISGYKMLIALSSNIIGNGVSPLKYYQRVY